MPRGTRRAVPLLCLHGIEPHGASPGGHASIAVASRRTAEGRCPLPSRQDKRTGSAGVGGPRAEPGCREKTVLSLSWVFDSSAAVHWRQAPKIHGRSIHPDRVGRHPGAGTPGTTWVVTCRRGTGLLHIRCPIRLFHRAELRPPAQHNAGQWVTSECRPMGRSCVSAGGLAGGLKELQAVAPARAAAALGQHQFNRAPVPPGELPTCCREAGARQVFISASACVGRAFCIVFSPMGDFAIQRMCYAGYTINKTGRVCAGCREGFAQNTKRGECLWPCDAHWLD